MDGEFEGDGTGQTTPSYKQEACYKALHRTSGLDGFPGTNKEKEMGMEFGIIQFS